MKTVSNVTQQQRESDGSPGLGNAGSIRPHLQAQFLPNLGIYIIILSIFFISLFFFFLSFSFIVLGGEGGGVFFVCLVFLSSKVRSFYSNQGQFVTALYHIPKILHEKYNRKF